MFTVKLCKRPNSKERQQRGKGKIAYISNSQARSCVLYQRKATSFQKGCTLHTMTNVKVIIVIDLDELHCVHSSLGLLESQNKGILNLTQVEHRYDALESSTDPDRPEI